MRKNQFLLFLLILALILVGLMICCHPFLQEYIYPLATVLSTVVIAWIAWENKNIQQKLYELQNPDIQGSCVVIHKDDQKNNRFLELMRIADCIKAKLEKKDTKPIREEWDKLLEKSSSGYFLYLYFYNAGYKETNISDIINENETSVGLFFKIKIQNFEKIDPEPHFKYLLEPFKYYKALLPLSEDDVKLLRKSKEIFIVDIKKRKYPILYSKEIYNPESNKL